MMISFDHASLKAMKAAIPGLKTGGIVHERFADPVAVARSADLDELCIDLSVYNPADAERLHAAGISIRCHAYKPAVFERALRAGLPWRETLGSSLRAGLIDTLSGDDVAWLRDFRDTALA
jgi:glycerophosphoryl diester phosphodiesterase